MPLRLYYDGKRASEVLTANMGTLAVRVRDAMRATARNMAQDIQQQTRVDIAGAGNFGSNWSDAILVKITEGGGNIRLAVTIDPNANIPPGAFDIFEYGGIIQGKPIMWIPNPEAGVEPGTWARDYPGLLVKIGDTLRDPITRDVIYFGVESVNMPQKFHTRDIIADVAGRFNSYYRAAYTSGKASTFETG